MVHRTIKLGDEMKAIIVAMVYAAMFSNTVASTTVKHHYQKVYSADHYEKGTDFQLVNP